MGCWIRFFYPHSHKFIDLIDKLIKNYRVRTFVSKVEEFFRISSGEIMYLVIGVRERNRPHGKLANFLLVSFVDIRKEFCGQDTGAASTMEPIGVARGYRNEYRTVGLETL